MGNSGINRSVPAQNNPGGDAMEQQTITMGQVTYELRRVFQGTRSLPELMAERIARQIYTGLCLSAAVQRGGPRRGIVQYHQSRRHLSRIISP